MKIKKKMPRKKNVADAEALQGVLEDTLSKITRGFENYRRVALLTLSLLIILGIAAAVYFSLVVKWDKKASVLEYRAYNYYLDGDYKNALSLYQKIIDDYSSSSSVAPVALYYVGNCYSGLGQYEQAVEAYNKFIRKYKGQKTILQLVYLNLGYSYMNNKDFDNAIAAFKQASTLKDSLIADRAVYESARAYEVSGDNISAIEQYEYLTKSYPASSWSQDASVKLNKAASGGLIIGSPIEKSAMEDETIKDTPVKEQMQDKQ